MSPLTICTQDGGHVPPAVLGPQPTGGQLRKAVIAGDLSKVKELVSQGGDLHEVDGSQKSALWYAASYDNVEVAQFLLRSSAIVDFADDAGLTPLHAASSKGNTATVKVLLSFKADVHSQTSRGLTALDLATKKGHGATAAVISAKMGSGGGVRYGFS